MKVEDAAAIKLAVQDLARSKRAGRPPADSTVQWLTDLKSARPEFLEKLKNLGLIQSYATPTLGAFTEEYIASRPHVQPNTAENDNQTRDKLVKFFGATKLLGEITPADADRWRIWLATKECLSEVTIRRHCGRAKQFLTAAVRNRLISSDPFEDLKSASLANPDREHFITIEMAMKVLDVLPTAQWQALFALSRFGGLRVPSEALLLRWEDVDRVNKLIRVRSPKTKRYAGKGERTIPLFPELEPYLLAAFHEAAPETEFVITFCRDAGKNLRTQLDRYITLAGLTPWEKTFQNCRATRETELVDQGFPEHLAFKWIGNSKKIARAHYLQVADHHFAKAIETPSLLEAARKAARAPEEMGCNDMQPEPVTSQDPAENAYSARFDNLPEQVEHPRDDSKYSGKNRVKSIEAARKAARPIDATACNRMQRDTLDDADLARIIELWPALSERSRHAVLINVEAMAPEFAPRD
jgi:integrase